METNEENSKVVDIDDINIFNLLTPEHKNVHQKVKRHARRWSISGLYNESLMADLAKDLAKWGFLTFVETRKDFKLSKRFNKECFRDYYKYKKDLPKEKISKIEIGDLESFFIKKESNFAWDSDLVFKVKKIRLPIIKRNYSFTKIINNVEFIFIEKRVNCVFKYKNQWFSVNNEITRYDEKQLNF